MRRFPPYDQQNTPSAPWVNGNADLGVQGSIIDCRAIDGAQSEIVNAILAAGLTPTENVLDQLAQAIPILAAEGGSDAIIDEQITKTVGTNTSDFPDLNAAFTWALRRRIIQPGQITFVHAPGKFNYTSDINFYHPDGDRIQIIAAPLASTLPPPSALTYSGNTQAARSQSLAANLAALRVAYGTEIYFQQANRFRVTGNLGLLQNFLISASGTGFQQDALVLGYGNQTLQNVSVAGAQNTGIRADRASTILQGICHVIGCYQGVKCTANGTMLLDTGATLGVQGNATQGLYVSANATFGITTDDVSGSGPVVYARGNGTNGVEANNGQIVLAASGQSLNNGNAGFFASNPCVIRAAGCVSDGNPYGFQSVFFAFLNAANTSGTSSSYAFRADNSSQIYRIGTTCNGAVSPAVGSIGNNNSITI